ncbi:16S rRNA (cytosine(1402)-N(4))-methyltransferase RsmH [Methylicorpusculum sp.]|uniref:16S rRNA (cytosine(1402)-N(4))-methyltransferase RsmH n=1 Tax=Methylicorpusculum sp. TaxID=2713644 RepID=UPI0027265FE5|nr:16S rRNA (cytosine(1402)-N(4))-methyltransferase RsmH [Methylicorpusculum sp.]MDO8845527.1 16S rRNA (cytosine(1402)-N(4))-methyltransferase RsmH [Methylicorpusculum sp.]
MQHRPVLFVEVLQALAIKEQGTYIDCTFGRGGHSQGILTGLGKQGRLLALDRDKAAVESAVAQELQQDARFTLVHNRFSALASIAGQHDLLGCVDGILMDLGVSSPQLDTPERGFSFMNDGPLDMRMDTHNGETAAQWLSHIDEQGLSKVLFEYGEERFARRIARTIVASRMKQPILTTRQLVELVEDAVPVREKHKHPATRTFQAIRLEINQELNELKTALDQAVEVLKPGGRLVVISFHSLEDRIVKRFIRAESGGKYDPGRLPIKESEITKGLLKKMGKAIKAGDEEVSENPRSRSAVMRVAEKI